MASMLPQFNLGRTRSYMFRLPLFTRLIITLIVAFWVVSIQSVWDVRAWGSLIPQETGVATCTDSFCCDALYVPLSGARAADMLHYSIQDEYVSSHTCRPLPCTPEHYCARPAVGTI